MSTGRSEALALERPLLRLRSFESSMHPSLLKVRDVIVSDPLESADLTIDALSERAGVSKATVVRFCKGLGYSGFRDFRAALIKEMAKQAPKAYGVAPPTTKPLAELLGLAVSSLDESVETLDPGAFETARERLRRSKQIVWYGTGMSGSFVQMIDHKFSLAGFNSRAFAEPARFLAESSRLTKDDVVVCVSHSGSTKTVVDPMRRIVKLPAYTIAVTNFADSPLARMCDLLLLTADREYWIDAFRIPFRHGQQLLLDALLYALVSEEGEGRLKRPW